ncbi:MAG: alpha/beta fold hydrolase [Marmoricola sp.]
MPELDGISYRVAGSGPALVVPQCNVDWSTVDLCPLERRRTVVTISPRGFMSSSRPDGYSLPGMVADVERVLDDLDIGDYATFGYSMNGAMASLLGVDNPRVRAVVCGGFPTTGPYDALAGRMATILQQTKRDPAVWAELVATHAPDAVLAFYEGLGRLAPGALVDRLAGPVWSWWGSEDERLEELGGIELHRQGLADRGLPFEVLAGLDHSGALDRIDLALPGALAWLETHCSSEDR